MPNRGQKASAENMHDIMEKENHLKSPISPDDIIFSLDIGTRTVVGVVGIEEDGIFNIIDVEVMEHKSRAMLDGQIHEISKVVEVVEIVKEKLESRLGFELTKVAIAAAGRSLKTNSAMVDQKLQSGTVITQDMVDSLELEGIQIANENLHRDNHDDTVYYCIGHTIVNYYLNGYVISDLRGHKGKVMSANVLATFLPHTVIDSLYTVIERVGLKVVGLTLEPIAAINVSIPKDIRLLNLALVDVGAGTSDIAITKDGTVTAYAMCSVAGDEITEKIAQNYLLDFNTAERVKIELQTKDIIEIEDIMGLITKVKSSEILKVIQPAVEHLAEIISQKIVECNGKAPNAVFCIGGGSQTQGLTRLLADKLGIPTERVGVRGVDIIKNIKFLNKKLSGPEAITPVGIAVTALMKRGHDFITVKVNKKKIKLFNSNKLTVGDALAASGITAEELIPRRGESLTFDLNKKKHEVKGGYGRPAQIFLNNKSVGIDTLINNEDQIKIIKSQTGQPAKVYVSDFVSETKSKSIVLNKSNLNFATKVLLNGNPAKLTDEVHKNDKLVIEEMNTIKDLINLCEIDTEKFYITVNGSRVNEAYKIKDQDVIDTVLKGKNDKFESENYNEDNKEAYELETKIKDSNSIKIAADSIDTGRKGIVDHNKNTITVNVNNDVIKLKGKTKYIFIDVFNYFKIDLADPKNRVVLKLNGMPASFTDSIREGDTIEIFWV